MPKSPPSGRALNNVINMTIEGIPVPVRLFSGLNKSDGPERHQYLPVPVLGEDGEPKTQTIEVEVDGEKTEKEVPVVNNIRVGQIKSNRDTKEPLNDDQIAQIESKTETEFGPVYIEDHELEQLFTLKANSLEIFTFQPQHLFHQGNYVPNNIMYIEPQVSGSGKSKAPMEFSVQMLATLFKAMREEGVVAVGELTTRGVPKPVVLTADGALWQVYHTNEVREQRPQAEVVLVEAEVDMMRTLIDQIRTTEVFDLTDERSTLIQDFAEKKAKAGDFGRPDADTYVAPEPKEPSVNLLAMLAASVENAKSKAS